MKNEKDRRVAAIAAAVLVSEHLDIGLSLENPLARGETRIAGRDAPVTGEHGLRVTATEKRPIRTGSERHSDMNVKWDKNIKLIRGSSREPAAFHEADSARYLSRMRLRF
jgi:hypothetical protein